VRDVVPHPERLVRFCGADCSSCETYKRFLKGDESGLVNFETNYRCCWLPKDYPRGKDCEIRTCCEEKRLLFCGECGQFEKCVRMKKFYSKLGYDKLKKRMIDEVEKMHARKKKPIESKEEVDQNIRDKLFITGNRLAKANVIWVLFAGAAAFFYGSNRMVTDVDILVKSEDLEKAKAALRNLEGVDIVADLTLKTSLGVYRFFMDDEMISKMRWKKLVDVKVPLIPVEDNIIFKAILQRGEAEGKHDIDDIKGMLRHEKLNIAYLTRRIQKYQAAKRVYPLLKELGLF